MTKYFQFVGLVTCLARILPAVMLVIVFAPPAQAKQQCAAAVPSPQKGHWTYRLVDGRKCWYPGRSALSKSVLYWSEETRAVAPRKPSAELVSARNDDRASIQPDSFESRWRGLNAKARLD